jgi:hypothetical protein
MADKDIILSEASREMMPQSLEHNIYYAGNDPSVQAEFRLKQEIIEHVKDMQPWQIELARRLSTGEPKTSIYKTILKDHSVADAFLRTGPGRTLVNYYVHLRILEDGLPMKVRKAMLERIAIDNEKQNPKESIRAIAELNKIALTTQVTGGFTVVINGVELKKGALDG